MLPVYHQPNVKLFNLTNSTYVTCANCGGKDIITGGPGYGRRRPSVPPLAERGWSRAACRQLNPRSVERHRLGGGAEASGHSAMQICNDTKRCEFFIEHRSARDRRVLLQLVNIIRLSDTNVLGFELAHDIGDLASIVDAETEQRAARKREIL
jgi:hypothetical protein